MKKTALGIAIACLVLGTNVVAQVGGGGGSYTGAQNSNVVPPPPGSVVVGGQANVMPTMVHMPGLNVQKITADGGVFAGYVSTPMMGTAKAYRLPNKSTVYFVFSDGNVYTQK